MIPVSTSPEPAVAAHERRRRVHERPSVRVGHDGGVALEQHRDAQLGGGAAGGGDPVGADLARDPRELAGRAG